MINNTGAAPLFWYIYRPGRKNSQGDYDGGFNVALYPDHRLVYCRFDEMNQIVDQSVFQLQPEFTAHYLTILESQAWWMGETPLKIRVGGKPQYSCMFGFAGHPLFICEEIDTLALAPFNSLRGMYARRLRMMLECLAEKLYAYGIGLTVDSFVWNWRMIQPINPGMQSMQMVEPLPEQMPMQETEQEYFGVAQ